MKRVLSLILVLAIGGSAYLFGWSDLFPVKLVSIKQNDELVAKELRLKLEESPKAILIGQPIARVDKRIITSRLQSLIWVDKVEIRRDFISGEVTISVSPRSAIARLNGRTDSTGTDLGFLGSELEIFYVTKEAVEKAARTGDTDWLKLPTLTLAPGKGSNAGNTEILEDVRTLISAITKFDGQVRDVRATNRDALVTAVSLGDRELDISWGSVKDLELKFEILTRLLDLRANKNVKRIDLSNPISPIVANSR